MASRDNRRWKNITFINSLEFALSGITTAFKEERNMALDPRLRFGLKLIEIRKTRGWSQERLALESGLARSYLGGVERGQRNIALLNIFKLAEALGVEPSVLLEAPAAGREPAP